MVQGAATCGADPLHASEKHSAGRVHISALLQPGLLQYPDYCNNFSPKYFLPHFCQYRFELFVIFLVLKRKPYFSANKTDSRPVTLEAFRSEACLA